MHGFSHRFRAFVSLLTAFAVVFTVLPFSVSAESAVHTLTPILPMNFREAPTTSSARIMTLPEDAVLTLLEDSENGWAHVRYGEYEGYAFGAYLEPAAGSDVLMTAIADTAVNLRSGPSTDFDKITVVPEGEKVKVSENYDENWAAVEFGSYSGYIYKEYLTFVFTIPQSSLLSHRSAKFGKPSDYSYSDSTYDSYKLMLASSALSLDINETYRLTVFDASSKPVTGGLQYSVSDSSIASVTSSGLVTGLKTGTAVITVRSVLSGVSASCKVSVSDIIKVTEPSTEPPTEAPTEAPTQPPIQGNGNISLSAGSATVYKGCMYQLIATSDSAVRWSSSDTSVATVTSDGIVKAVSTGSAVITASTFAKSVTCRISVISGNYVSLSHFEAAVTAGKTFLARSYTYGVSWSSADTSVATVNNGYILAKKAGKTVVTAASSDGAATIMVTVKEAEPIRFAYTSPNCASKNQTVTLIAVTDNTRTAVKFNVTVGSDVRTVNASSVKDGKTLVWKGTTSFSAAGTYKVAAYSKLNGKWSTCDDGATTAFVSDTDDMITTVCTKRRASDGVISLIANFEGYISSIYNDPITGDPTVGYGRVIYPGEQFYNTMTKTEAFAYLVQTVNNTGYASKVNSFLVDNKVKFNQQQFDALVSLVYNTGAGVLSGDTQLQYALLDCHDGSGGDVTYYINGSGVRLRKGAGTEYDIIKELSYNTVITVLSDKNSAWYKVKLNDGTVGYISSDYISKRYTGGNLDLNYVDRQNLINKFCQYHHAGGGCVYGLLYRRVDEMEIFFYGDYERNYGVYKYDIQFTCSINSSFHT